MTDPAESVDVDLRILPKPFTFAGGSKPCLYLAAWP